MVKKHCEILKQNPTPNEHKTAKRAIHKITDAAKTGAQSLTGKREDTSENQSWKETKPSNNDNNNMLTHTHANINKQIKTNVNTAPKETQLPCPNYTTDLKLTKQVKTYHNKRPNILNLFSLSLRMSE